MIRPLTHAALLAAVPVWVRAEDAAPPGPGGGLLQVVLSLGVVLLVLFASLWLLKRLSAPRGAASGLLRVIAGAAVGPRERVVVVEVADVWLVLGVAPGQVTALTQIPRQERAPAGFDDAPPGAGGDFAAWLRKTMERRRGA